MKANSVAYIVFNALRLWPDLRQVTTGEERLIVYVHAAQKNNAASANTKLSLSKSGTISRVARDIRLKHPELRGTDWEENHKHAEPKVRREIKEGTFGRAKKNPDIDSFINIQPPEE